jgi:imidazolonepropionase-like amidohydrolase
MERATFSKSASTQATTRLSAGSIVQAATATSAIPSSAYDGYGELGTLEPGKIADLVIADGDALDTHNLGDRIRAVHQDGVLVAAPQPQSRIVWAKRVWATRAFEA